MFTPVDTLSIQSTRIKDSIPKLAAFSNLQTMWSMFAGVLFLREPFDVSSFIGSVLILYGIWKITK